MPACSSTWPALGSDNLYKVFPSYPVTAVNFLPCLYLSQLSFCSSMILPQGLCSGCSACMSVATDICITNSVSISPLTLLEYHLLKALCIRTCCNLPLWVHEVTSSCFYLPKPQHTINSPAYFGL